jgi:hypothetical protein
MKKQQEEICRATIFQASDSALNSKTSLTTKGIMITIASLLPTTQREQIPTRGQSIIDTAAPPLSPSAPAQCPVPGREEEVA